MIQYGEWKINANILKTKMYYDAFSMPTDKFARNYRVYCDMLTREEREFFDSFGIDPKCAYVKSLGMKNGKIVPTSGYYFIFGDFEGTPAQPTVSVEDLIRYGITSFGKDNAVRVGSFRFEFQLPSDPNADIPDNMPENCICVRFFCDTLPWLINEKCDKKVKEASGLDKLLSRFARRNTVKGSSAYADSFRTGKLATATNF